MISTTPRFIIALFFLGLLCAAGSPLRATVGVGAKPLPGAEVLFDGTSAMLTEKWIYWEGPRFGAKSPIKWPLVEDPVGKGTVLSTNDPGITATTVGKYGVGSLQQLKDPRSQHGPQGR